MVPGRHQSPEPETRPTTKRRASTTNDSHTRTRNPIPSFCNCVLRLLAVCPAGSSISTIPPPLSLSTNMEAWDIANNSFRRYSWWLSSSSPTVTMTTNTSYNHDDEAVERQELQVWDKDEGDDEIRSSLLMLRHTHNPKSSPSRVFVGTMLLALMIYIVVKMLSVRANNFPTARSEE
jgi:hypothetical protein